MVDALNCFIQGFIKHSPQYVSFLPHFNKLIIKHYSYSTQTGRQGMFWKSDSMSDEQFIRYLVIHRPICMSAKLKKLSTSLEDVFLLSETKTCGKKTTTCSRFESLLEKENWAFAKLEKRSATTTVTVTLVPLNTSLAMFLQASTTPSPFSSRAMTGPLERRHDSHSPAFTLNIQ